MHCRKPVLGLFDIRTEWEIRNDLGVVGDGLLRLFQFFKRLSQIVEGGITTAEVGIPIHDLLEPGLRRGKCAALVIELCRLIIARRQHLLSHAQPTLHAGHQRTVGVFQQELLEFNLRQLGFGSVAVRFSHETVVRHAHPVLRFRRLWSGRKESDEVLILGFSLRQARDSALVVIRVSDGQLCLRQVFAVGICVDEGLQSKPANVEAPMVDLVGRLLVEDLVRLVTRVNLRC